MRKGNGSEAAVIEAVKKMRGGSTSRRPCGTLGERKRGEIELILAMRYTRFTPETPMTNLRARCPTRPFRGGRSPLHPEPNTCPKRIRTAL
jgi:hypothetical protein